MTAYDRVLAGGVLAAALGAGVIAGVFFAFSVFVMRALGRLPVETGMSAMQSINVVVLNPLFLAPFVGTALFGLAVPVVAWWRGLPYAWLLAGGLLYTVGVFGVTAAGNVPLNDALAGVDPNSPAAQSAWADYQRDWTRWNHVRTACGVAASAAFIVGFKT